MHKEIKFKLNGKDVVIETDPVRRLLDVLREDFKLTGVKEGCSEGECGACVVFINDILVNSCMVPMANVINKKVMTIEGFKETKEFEVIEKAFLEAGAVQCGFCTPGMILATENLLRNIGNPSVEEIKEGLSGHICRCTGYQAIIDAVQLAVKEGGGLWKSKVISL
ncbi:MAG: (2Fe-2S)-binding protein [Bacillota bacterium]|nr:(2Fe-2S)-binding protein [Bacillota bacterium]